jgi:hypothetical protein
LGASPRGFIAFTGARRRCARWGGKAGMDFEAPMANRDAPSQRARVGAHPWLEHSVQTTPARILRSANTNEPVAARAGAPGDARVGAPRTIARTRVRSSHHRIGGGGSRGSHRAQSKLARRGATHGARRARRTKTLEDAAWREAPRCGLIGIRCRNVKGPCLTPPSAHTVACALPVRCPYVPCALCVRASRAARACPGALPGTRVPRFVRDACGPIRASHFGIACRYTGRAESVKERRGRSANPNSVKERSGGECWWS